MKRAVITGIGAVTPLGNTFTESWKRLLKGRSGIGPITHFDATALPWKVAGQARDFRPDDFLSSKEQRRLDPFAQYAVSAALMSAEDAGLQPHSSLLQEEGVIIGSSRGGISSIEKAMSRKGQAARCRPSPYLMPATTISMAATYTALKLGIHGHCLGISNACASGANAVAEAFRLIRYGHADVVLAGGAEAPVCRLCVEGYGTSGALSKNNSSSASRPFDKSRDGFVLSEGACILTLESLESAMKRGARIYAEIIGCGITVDALHQTRPDARGEARAITKALDDAATAPEAVDYVNTHGTSTDTGDAAEASAIRAVFGGRADTIPCSAIKSLTGHMLAASGAFETACTAMTLNRGVIPPTPHCREKDPACNINVITEKTRTDAKIAVTASFGFGGVNAVLVMKQFP